MFNKTGIHKGDKYFIGGFKPRVLEVVLGILILGTVLYWSAL